MTNRKTNLIGLCCLAAFFALYLLACSPSHTPQGAILIVIDTLRRDHVGLYGYDRDTTPNLDAFSKQAVVFERALSNSPWTLPAFGSILTSRLPSYHGAVGSGEKFFALESSATTIQEILSRSGFATAAFTNSPFLGDQFQISRGFDIYNHYDGNNHDTRRADEMTDLALEWLRGIGERKFFVLLHYFDPHLDYDPPADFAMTFMPNAGFTKPFRVSPSDLEKIRTGAIPLTETKMDTIIALYDAEILYTDSAIGRLLDGLKDMNLFHNTGIMITADHGEEFWDHGGFEHGHSLYGELIDVPLLVRLPGSAGNSGRVAERVSLIDLAPTLLSYLGVDAPLTFQGRDFSGWLNNGSGSETSACSEALLFGDEKKSITQADYKYILSVTGEHELYNLEKDPGEQSNIAGTNQRLSQILRESLYGVFGSPTEATSPREPSLSLEPETLEQLKALGYIR